MIWMPKEDESRSLAEELAIVEKLSDGNRFVDREMLSLMEGCGGKMSASSDEEYEGEDEEDEEEMDEAVQYFDMLLALEESCTTEEWEEFSAMMEQFSEDEDDDSLEEGRGIPKIARNYVKPSQDNASEPRLTRKQKKAEPVRPSPRLVAKAGEQVAAKIASDINQVRDQQLQNTGSPSIPPAAAVKIYRSGASAAAKALKSEPDKLSGVTNEIKMTISRSLPKGQKAPFFVEVKKAEGWVQALISKVKEWLKSHSKDGKGSAAEGAGQLAGKGLVKTVSGAGKVLKGAYDFGKGAVQGGASTKEVGSAADAVRGAAGKLTDKVVSKVAAVKTAAKEKAKSAEDARASYADRQRKKKMAKIKDLESKSSPEKAAARDKRRFDKSMGSSDDDEGGSSSKLKDNKGNQSGGGAQAQSKEVSNSLKAVDFAFEGVDLDADILGELIEETQESGYDLDDLFFVLESFGLTCEDDVIEEAVALHYDESFLYEGADSEDDSEDEESDDSEDEDSEEMDDEEEMDEAVNVVEAIAEMDEDQLESMDEADTLWGMWACDYLTHELMGSGELTEDVDDDLFFLLEAEQVVVAEGKDTISNFWQYKSSGGRKRRIPTNKGLKFLKANLKAARKKLKSMPKALKMRALTRSKNKESDGSVFWTGRGLRGVGTPKKLEAGSASYKLRMAREKARKLRLKKSKIAAKSKKSAGADVSFVEHNETDALLNEFRTVLAENREDSFDETMDEAYEICTRIVEGLERVGRQAEEFSVRIAEDIKSVGQMESTEEGDDPRVAIGVYVESIAKDASALLDIILIENEEGETVFNPEIDLDIAMADLQTISGDLANAVNEMSQMA